MNTTFSFLTPAKMTVFHPINIIIGRFLLTPPSHNSRIQKLINSLTRGHTSKTEGGDPPIIWIVPEAVGDPDIAIEADPRATAQHAP